MTEALATGIFELCVKYIIFAIVGKGATDKRTKLNLATLGSIADTQPNASVHLA
jgi:hypothetical protein